MTGIHRPVVLYTVPSFIHLTDVTLATDVTKELDSAAIYYQVEHKSSPSEIAEECRVEIQGGHLKSFLNITNIKYNLYSEFRFGKNLS